MALPPSPHAAAGSGALHPHGRILWKSDDGAAGACDV